MCGVLVNGSSGTHTKCSRTTAQRFNSRKQSVQKKIKDWQDIKINRRGLSSPSSKLAN